MATEKVTTCGPAVTVLVGVLEHGSDPSRGESGNPAKLRSTVRSQTFNKGGKLVQGLLTGTVGKQSASFEVVNNDFATGRAVIRLGDYQVISGMDYQPGADVGATATNIAAAISALPGFTATANVAEVTINYSTPVGDVTFEVLHLGTVANFGTVTPSTGFMTPGGPNIGAPGLT